MYKVPEALGILEEENMGQIQALHRLCGDSLYNTTSESMHNSTSEAACAAPINYIQHGVGGDAFGYDMRIFGYEWDRIEAPVSNYFSSINTNESDVYLAIHVENSTKVPIFMMSNDTVDEYLVYDNLLDYVTVYEDLLSTNYSSPILIYDGEMDARDGAFSQNTWLANMTFTDSESFFN